MSKNKYIFAIEGTIDNESIYYSNILYRRFKKHLRRLRESKIPVNKLMSMPVELKDKVTFYNLIDNTQDVEINERSTIKIPTFTTDIDYYSNIFIKTNKEHSNNRSLKSIFENKNVANTIVGDKIEYNINFMKEINEIDLGKEVYIQEISFPRITGSLHALANKSLEWGLTLFTVDNITQLLTGHGMMSVFNKGNMYDLAITGGISIGAYMLLTLIINNSKRDSEHREAAKKTRDIMVKLGKKGGQIVLGAFNALKKFKIREMLTGRVLKTPLGKIISRIDFDSDSVHTVVSPRSSIDFSAVKITPKNDKAIIASLKAMGIEPSEDIVESFKSIGTFADLLFFLSDKKQFSSDSQSSYTPNTVDVSEIREGIRLNRFLRANGDLYVKNSDLSQFLARYITKDLILRNIGMPNNMSSGRKFIFQSIVNNNKLVKICKDDPKFLEKINTKFLNHLKAVTSTDSAFYKKYLSQDNINLIIEEDDILVEITDDSTGKKVKFPTEFNIDTSKASTAINLLKRSIVDTDTTQFLETDFNRIKDAKKASVAPDDEEVYELTDDMLMKIKDKKLYEDTEEYRAAFIDKSIFIANIVKSCQDKKKTANLRKCIKFLSSNGALDETKFEIALARIGYESASLFSGSNEGIFNALKIFEDAIAATTTNIKCYDEDEQFSIELMQKSILENQLSSCLNLQSREKYASEIREFVNSVYVSGVSKSSVEKLIKEIYDKNDNKPVTTFGERMEKNISDSFMEILDLQAAILEGSSKGETRLGEFLKKYAESEDRDTASAAESVIKYIRETGGQDKDGNFDFGERFVRNFKNMTKFLFKRGTKTDSEFIYGERNSELLNNILKSGGDSEAIFQETIAMPSKGVTSNVSALNRFVPWFSEISNLWLKTVFGLGLVSSVASPLIASYINSSNVQPSTEFAKVIERGESSSEKGLKIDMIQFGKELEELQDSIGFFSKHKDKFASDKCFLHVQDALEFAENNESVGVKKLFSELGIDLSSDSVENYKNLVAYRYFIDKQARESNDCSNSFSQLHSRLVDINRLNISEDINNLTRQMIERIHELSKDYNELSEKYKQISVDLESIEEKIKRKDPSLAGSKPEEFEEMEDPDDITRFIRGWDIIIVKNSKGEEVLVPYNFRELRDQFNGINDSIREKIKTAIVTQVRHEALENNRLVVFLNIIKNIKTIASDISDIDKLCEDIAEIAETAVGKFKVSALRHSGLAEGKWEALAKLLALIITSLFFRLFKQLKLSRGLQQGALRDIKNHIRLATNFTIYHVESQILRNDIISVLDLNSKIMEQALDSLKVKEEKFKDFKRAVSTIAHIRKSIKEEDLKTSPEDLPNDTNVLLQKLGIIETNERTSG